MENKEKNIKKKLEYSNSSGFTNLNQCAVVQVGIL